MKNKNCGDVYWAVQFTANISTAAHLEICPKQKIAVKLESVSEQFVVAFFEVGKNVSVSHLLNWAQYVKKPLF